MPGHGQTEHAILSVLSDGKPRSQRDLVRETGLSAKSVEDALYRLWKIRTLANYTTLIVRNTLFLFMGDADDKVLNDFVRLNDQPYLFVKASHHGKYYGRGLNSLSTVVLAVSRDGRTKIHRGYFHRMKWNILIDTIRHGTCSIIL